MEGEKFYDIIPPGNLQPENKNEESKKEKSKPVFDTEKPQSSRRPVKFGSFFKILGILFLVLILGAGAIFVFAKSTAQIDIWPKREIASGTDKIIIDSSARALNLEGKIIPVKTMEVEKKVEQQSTSTGSSDNEQKAKGTVRLFNNYSSSPQTLVAGTRLVSSEGKLFRTVGKIIIPGKTVKNGKDELGQIDVEVIAAEAGPDYNIGPSAFSIPGFAGTARFTAFYGRSSVAMEGGIRGKGTQVTQADIERAKTSTIEKAGQEAKEALIEAANKEGYSIIEKSAIKETVGTKSSAGVGEKIASFSFEARVNYKVLAFKQADLESIAKYELSLKASSGKKMREGSLKTDWIAELGQKETDKDFLNVNYSAIFLSELKEESILKSLAGKSEKEAGILLNNDPTIEKAEVKVSPFWVKNIPQQENRVKVHFRID